MKQSITVDEVIAYLNELNILDPQAIYNLFNHREACYDNFDLYPSILTLYKGGQSHLGILGIMNGMFGLNAEGKGQITALIGDCEITSFVKTITGRTENA
jgi:hypothetical protein